MIMLREPTVDLDAVDALADKFVAPDRPPMPAAWCASCWAVPYIETCVGSSRVRCACGNDGPYCATIEDAKTAWNKQQWARYSTDKDDQYDGKDGTTADERATRRASVARAYAAFRQRNPLTIAARSWATHRVSSCCGAAYAIKRHHKQDDPRAVCRKCGKAFAVAPILKNKGAK